MRKLNKKGFTLLEMLMVMFIISVLLLLIIPNITQHKDSVEETSCDAYVETVQAQVLAYELAEGSPPASLNDLESAGYINSTTCSDGTPLQLTDDEVSISQ